MIGSTVSHYKILEKLGEGGMGIVYKAHDTRLDRVVALKFLPPGMSSGDDHKQRFLQEARAAAQLHHPNICTVFSLEDGDPQPFIVMEFIEGSTLQEKLGTPLDPDESTTIALQVGDALREAHSRGIVHRDIKPSNIMLTADRRAKVMDFGLARMSMIGTNLTKSGTVLGTLHYMSPEQLQGFPVDQRSDIFSFGVVLYEMLTGKRPFDADYQAALLYAIINQDPVRADELIPSLPRTLADTVVRCLAKRPEDRYATMDEVLRDLQSSQGRMTRGISRGETLALPLQPFSPEESPFVGRAEPLQRMRSVLEQAILGRGYTLFLTGEAGVGKSRLMRVVAAEAHGKKIPVLWGRCLFREEGVPYHAFVSAFKTGFDLSEHQLISALAANAQAQGISFENRLVQLKSFLNVGHAEANLVNKEQLWDSVLTALRVLAARQPLLVIIDDLQWADRTTSGLFAFLSRNITASRIQLVGIYRPGEWSNDREISSTVLDNTVRQLRIENLADQIDLPRLSHEETGHLTGSLLDNRPVEKGIVDVVHRSTQGNPLFVTEVVNLLKTNKAIEYTGAVWKARQPMLETAIPSKLRDGVLQRLSALSREEQRVLEVASCDGDYFRSETVASCLGLDRLTLLTMLQSLEKNHHLIRHEARRYRFDCPLFRQVVYEEMLIELREEYHRMIGSWLVRAYPDSEEHAPQIASHFLAAGLPVEALPYLVRAAHRARILYATEEALRLYTQAREILEQQHETDPAMSISVLEGLGDVLTSLGHVSEANGLYAQLLGKARAGRVLDAEARALYKLADTFRVLGQTEEAVRHGEEAVALAHGQGMQIEEIMSLNTLGFIYSNRIADYPRALELYTRALHQAEAAGDLRSQATSLSNIGLVQWHRGEYSATIEPFERALALQRSIGDTKGLATTLNFAGLSYHRLGEYEKALSYHNESLRVKESITDYPAIPGSLNNIGEVYRDLGDTARAVGYHERGLALAREQHNPGAECDNLRDLAADYLEAGDLTAAESHITQVLHLAQEKGLTWYIARAYIILSDIAAARGDGEHAAQYSQEAVRSAFELHANELKIEALRSRAGVVAREGDTEEAIRLLSQAIAIAESVGHRLFLWRMYASRARLEEVLHRNSEGAASLATARALLREGIAKFKDVELRNLYLNSNKVKEVLGPNI
jgi:tetratricopeptide (TPR) repeat protein/predicted Ser/Thr protein kinase